MLFLHANKRVMEIESKMTIKGFDLIRFVLTRPFQRYPMCGVKSLALGVKLGLEERHCYLGFRANDWYSEHAS